MRDLAPALGLALALAGCSFTPRYERPTVTVAEQFADPNEGRAAADLGWRDVFGDARLQAVITLALQHNTDLRLAALNVELARAQYRIDRAGLVPLVDGTGSMDLRGGANPQNPNFQPPRVTYRVGISASWEIDLFGRLRNLKDAALHDYLATESTRRATQLALVAEVATQFLRERAFVEQLELAAQTVVAMEQAVEMTRRLLDAGRRSELDVRTAEAQLAGAQAEVARLTRARAQAHNALVLLVGQPLPAGLAPATPLDTQPVVEEIGSGVPSIVLTRRPDVIAAEHTLLAANYNIGAARAAFLPNISLTGFAGLASTALGNLFSTGSYGWTVGPQVSVPLFTGGRNRASLDVAKVRKRAEIVRYERAIQTAFREVADALSARATLELQLAAQTARTGAEQRRYELSESRYQNGVESYLAVLSAQQDLYGSRQQLIEIRFARLANLVELYRALGGGWHERSL